MLSEIYESCLDPAKKPHDLSYIWRPAIEEHSQNHDHDIRAWLLAAIRDAAEPLAARGPDAARELIIAFQNKQWLGFRRVAIHLLRKLSGPVNDLVRNEIFPLEKWAEPGTKHEYVMLLKDCFSSLSTPDREAILQWIEKGPEDSDWGGWFESRIGRPPTPEDIEKHRRVWQRDHYSPIAEFLSDEIRTKLDASVKEFGHPTLHEFSAVMGDWVGPESPLSRVEILDLDPEVLVEKIRAWVPKGDWDGPSREGLGRELSEAVAANPERFSSLPGLLQVPTIHPTYARHLLYGFGNAIQNKKPGIPYLSLLEFCRWILYEASKESSPRPSSSRHGSEDPGWGWTQKAIADLLLKMLEHSDCLPFSAREAIWALILPLTRDPDPSPSGKDSEEDPTAPYSTAINSTRGTALQAVVSYALWVSRHTHPAGQVSGCRSFDEMPEVKEILNHHLDPCQEASTAVHSVFGRVLPFLHYLDSSWLEKNVTRIFPLDPSQRRRLRAAWDTYLLFSHFHSSIFPILSPVYEWAADEAVGSSSIKASPKEPACRAAQHIICLYAQKIFDLDNPLIQKLFRLGSDELLSSVIEFIGRSLDRKSEIQPELEERFRRLWEWHFASIREEGKPELHQIELNAFSWWFYFGPIVDSWLLARLSEVLPLVTNGDNDGFIVDRLVEVAEQFPAFAVDCFRKLVEHNKNPWLLSGHEDVVKKAMTTLLASSNEKVGREARVVINTLLSRGFFQFKDLLS